MHLWYFAYMLGAMKKGNPQAKDVAIGVAWYRREQWPRLLEIASDRDKLEDSYDEWLAGAVKALGMLGSQGLNPVKVDIDTEELLAWCASRNLPVDAKARVAYTTEKVKKSLPTAETLGRTGNESCRHEEWGGTTGPGREEYGL